MIGKRLRFRDLVDRNIVKNRPTLTNWIAKYNFPTGQLTGPNTRTWGEDEVQCWLDNRPTAPKTTPLTPGRPPGPRIIEASLTAPPVVTPPKTAPPSRVRRGRKEAAEAEA
jgi:hypothetical protein